MKSVSSQRTEGAMSQTDIKQVPLHFFTQHTFFLKTKKIFFNFFFGFVQEIYSEKYTSENGAITLVLGEAAGSQTQINKTLLSSSFGLTSAPSAQKRLAELGHGDQTPVLALSFHLGLSVAGTSGAAGAIWLSLASGR